MKFHTGDALCEVQNALKDHQSVVCGQFKTTVENNRYVRTREVLELINVPHVCHNGYRADATRNE